MTRKQIISEVLNYLHDEIERYTVAASHLKDTELSKQYLEKVEYISQLRNSLNFLF